MGAPKGVKQPRREDWPMIRHAYETTGLGYRKLAPKFDVNPETLRRRIEREGWTKRGKLILQTAEKRVTAAVERQAKALVDRELGPWIEKKKAQFVKDSVTVAHSGLLQCRTIQKDAKRRRKATGLSFDAKDTADTARAVESYVRAGRTSLGLTDAGGAPGPVNFQILCNQAAIVASPTKQSQD